MLKMLHKNCGGNLYVAIEMENVFGKPNVKVKGQNQIFISFASLIAFKVKLKATGLYCDKCNQTLEDSEGINLYCNHTGKKDAVDNFRIIYAIKPETGEELRPQLLHITMTEDYKKDCKTDGFAVTEIEPKIYLDKEIKHG